MSTGDSVLQVNTRGSWKNVVSFSPDREDDIVVAVAPLAQALPDAKWAILRPGGDRRWLPDTHSAAGGAP